VSRHVAATSGRLITVDEAGPSPVSAGGMGHGVTDAGDQVWFATDPQRIVRLQLALVAGDKPVVWVEAHEIFKVVRAEPTV
jgi:hypothetical protein